MWTQIALSYTNLALPVAIMKREKRELTFKMWRKTFHRERKGKETWNADELLKDNLFHYETI